MLPFPFKNWTSDIGLSAQEPTDLEVATCEGSEQLSEVTWLFPQARAAQSGLPMKRHLLARMRWLAAHAGISSIAAWANADGSELQVQGSPQGRRNPALHQLPRQPLLPGPLLQGALLRRVLAMCARCLTWGALRTTRMMMGRTSTMLVERRAAR